MAHSSHIDDRFLDVGEEPKQALMPIEGYENKPLVSLEQAVEPIEKTLYKLETKVKTAKWNSRQPSDGLSSDESAAIQLYTMEWSNPYPSLYTLLNQQLRSNKRKNLTPWFSYLKLFLTALYKLPSFKGTIWRGVHQDVSDQYNEDCIWWGVSSCTETLNVTEEFIGRVGQRTLFNIECINGKAIKAHAFNSKENEVILMPGTYLRVVGKSSPAEDLHIIHLRETAPPYQTIAPPFDRPTPLVESPTPFVQPPAPSVEPPTPFVESPTPFVEPPTPFMELPSSQKKPQITVAQINTPYSEKKLRCKGRACALCDKCRDWYWCYSGSKKIYEKRADATCTGVDFDDFDDDFVDRDRDYWHRFIDVRRPNVVFRRDDDCSDGVDRLCECDDNSVYSSPF